MVGNRYDPYRNIRKLLHKTAAQFFQQRSRQEHQIAQATLARALNRLRVKNMGIGR